MSAITGAPKEVAQYRLWIVARNARLAQVSNGYIVPAVQAEQSFEEIARTIADLRSQVSSAGLPEWVRARREMYYTMLWESERYERERFFQLYLASSLFVNNCLAADFIYHRRTGSDRLLVLEKVLVEAWFNQAALEVRHRIHLVWQTDAGKECWPADELPSWWFDLLQQAGKPAQCSMY